MAAPDPEPSENISGGEEGGGELVDLEALPTETRAARVVARLGEHYWQKAYGGQDAFPCLVRTILSQNTNDTASQAAFDALLERYGSTDDLATTLAAADSDDLATVIEPAGLYHQKAARIVEIAGWVTARFGSAAAFDAYVTEEDPKTVRQTLLDRRGVGPKTADCVLLFAGGREGVFPVDTHVHRLYRRLGIAPPDADHETVRTILEGAVPAEACGFGHTASIQFGREYCSARSPVCLEDETACPLADCCEQVGVDPEAETVVDPGDVSDS